MNPSTSSSSLIFDTFSNETSGAPVVALASAPPLVGRPAGTGMVGMLAPLLLYRFPSLLVSFGTPVGSVLGIMKARSPAVLSVTGTAVFAEVSVRFGITIGSSLLCPEFNAWVEMRPEQDGCENGCGAYPHEKRPVPTAASPEGQANGLMYAG